MFERLRNVIVVLLLNLTAGAFAAESVSDYFDLRAGSGLTIVQTDPVFDFGPASQMFAEGIAMYTDTGAATYSTTFRINIFVTLQSVNLIGHGHYSGGNFIRGTRGIILKARPQDPSLIAPSLIDSEGFVKILDAPICLPTDNGCTDYIDIGDGENFKIDKSFPITIQVSAREFKVSYLADDSHYRGPRIDELDGFGNPLPPACGDYTHPYPAMDFNHDCYVNMTDFTQFAAEWLDSTSPESVSDNTRYICVRDSIGWTGNLIFDEVNQKIPPVEGAQVRVGVGNIYYTLDPSGNNTSGARNGEHLLQEFLTAAEQTNTPVVVNLDVELALDPAFLNWWDPSKPGYDPNKVNNVEWYGWGPQYAIKLCWRNWGFQMRIPPTQNYMSPAYRILCHQVYDSYIPIILSWWNNLPADKKDLFIGVIVGCESGGALGGAWYANGNYYIETWPNDPSHDPTGPRYEYLGYAAVKTLHPERTSGTLTEADFAEVTYTHLADLSHKAMELGLPREKIFTHGQTYRGTGSNIYAAVNEYSCPGWSDYSGNVGGLRAAYSSVNNAVATSGAPSWGVPEFFFGGTTTDSWRQVMENILNPILDPVCRYLNISNWSDMNTNQTILNAIQQVVQNSVSTCGDMDHPYPLMAFNHDCYVNLYDLDMFIEEWLNCTAPEPPCNYVP